MAENLKSTVSYALEHLDIRGFSTIIHTELTYPIIFYVPLLVDLLGVDINPGIVVAIIYTGHSVMLF